MTKSALLNSINKADFVGATPSVFHDNVSFRESFEKIALDNSIEVPQMF
jgi:hypothetical protein